jgi:sugar phosphate isomerase/epimerase
MTTFGVSTHLYHEQRLQQAHLAEIAAHGFSAVEVFATRTHFDYHELTAVDSLASWLAAAKLTLRSVHAPITDAFANGKAQRTYSIAARDADARKAAVREIEQALNIASAIPFDCLVVHVGVPDGARPTPDDNHREAAIRSLEEILSAAARRRVRVALEVMGNELSTASQLVDLIDRNFEDAELGICMDVGHAHLLGDAAEAIETASEYLWTTHIHDNGGRSDDHLVPFQGGIDWGATMMAFEKIGYDGVLMFEVKDAGGTQAVLARAAAARQRLERLATESTRLFPDSF